VRLRISGGKPCLYGRSCECEASFRGNGMVSCGLRPPSLYIAKGGGDNWSAEPADSKNHSHV
jgi:hypothetical protein